jgi:hypothetical protein
MGSSETLSSNNSCLTTFRRGLYRFRDKKNSTGLRNAHFKGSSGRLASGSAVCGSADFIVYDSLR